MLLAIRGEVTTRELALSLGITERAVHRILRDLAESGFIYDRKAWLPQPVHGPPGDVGWAPAFPSLTLGELLAPVLAGAPGDRIANGASRNGAAHAEELTLVASA